MVDYREFLPEPSPECRDPELFRLLNEFHFVRWHPDCEPRRDELRWMLRTAPILARAEQAVDDPCESLRRYAGQLLIWIHREQSTSFVLKLLSDESEMVRGEIAQVFSQLRCDACLERLVKLATTDVSPFARRGAAAGLGGQDPLMAIPVLLDILEHDHEACATGHTPSQAAATALDEMMETEWTQQRHPGGLRSLPAGQRDLAALRDQALLYLQHRQHRKAHGG